MPSLLDWETSRSEYVERTEGAMDEDDSNGNGQSPQPPAGPPPSSPAAPAAGGDISGAPRQAPAPSYSLTRSVSQAAHSQGTPAPTSSFRGSVGGMTPYSARPRRGDLGHDSRLRGRPISFGPPSSAPEPSEARDEDDEDGEQTCVWGTDINVPGLCRRLRHFLKNFREEGEEEAKYVALLRQLREDGEYVLNIDCRHIHSFDTTLYSNLVNYPCEVTSLLDSEARSLLAELTGLDEADLDNLVTKPHNLIETKVIRDLNPSDINKLISVSGMITRTSNVIPDLRVAVFKCQKCGTEEWRHNDRGRIEEPKRCPEPSCNTQWSMSMIHNRCAFYNKQIVKMQENPNAIPEGETPHSVTMLCFDEMVDTAKPGDRVTVTGIYKAVPMRVKPRMRMLKSIYKTHIDILHVQRDEKSRLFSVAQDQAAADAAQTDEALAPGSDMTREQREAKEAELRALAAEPDIYDKLVASLAPSIYQMEDVKKGILCQLFGGASKDFTGGKIRGELNVLLVGDPGVSKSQLLTYVNKIAPRGLYTSGRGSSAVGLTAYVTKDAETREMVLESGALVLSDKGVCCIDEFDKMSDSARSMLHEVMEQQTVSVAKAGIIASLNARTSVLASANPVGSRYNPRLSVVDNISLPASLLSRFDLIYLVLDKAKREDDEKLARHLVSLYYEEQLPSAQAVIPMDKLRDFIAFARKCQPQLTKATAEDLIANYLQLRRAGQSRKVISATPRQLESIIRISEALAKMRLSATVERSDVAEAVRLMKEAMQQSATDPATGAIDMDIIQTGFSKTARVARQQLGQELFKLIAGSSNGLTQEDLLQKMAAQSSLPVEAQQINEALKTLSDKVVREGTRYKSVMTREPLL